LKSLVASLDDPQPAASETNLERLGGAEECHAGDPHPVAKGEPPAEANRVFEPRFDGSIRPSASFRNSMVHSRMIKHSSRPMISSSP
jgi:hypothetical protein